jgi:isocitrate/isopropylmalate dehydrogenase
MKAKIVALGGDGIGPEVMEEGLRVLSAVEEVLGLVSEVRSFKCGWQYYQKHKSLWEPGAFESCKEWADAVLFGAVGWPGARPKRWGTYDGSVILDLRYNLELYANVRPVRLMPGVPTILNKKQVKVWDPDDVDLVFIRENLEDLYSGAMETPYPKEDTQVQIDERRTSRKCSERIIRFAFQEALNRAGKQGRRKGHKTSVTCVDKSNAFPGCALFRETFEEVAKDFEQVPTGKYYIDAFQLALLQDPTKFDVVVTPNFIGDIVTDLAALLQGGLGMAPSANIGSNKGLFEPVHGSAPDIAGKGFANPTGMILSIGMMFAWLGNKTKEKKYIEAHRIVEDAVAEHYRTSGMRTMDLGGSCGTKGLADSIISIIKKKT